ncbi:MAG: copper-binding protein [Burkholderiaceae bacterium]
MKKISLFGISLFLVAACSQAALPVTNAEIRAVDGPMKSVTLKHEEIKNLNMMPMTMSFPVKDGVSLDKLNAGDKVKFTADMVKGTMTVMSIELAK